MLCISNVNCNGLSLDHVVVLNPLSVLITSLNGKDILDISNTY